MEWARLACSPPRHPVVLDKGMPQPLPTAEQEEVMGRRFDAIGERITRIRSLIRTLPGHALVWAGLDSIALDNVLPETWTRPDQIHRPALDALKRGLDLLAGEYRIPLDQPINQQLTQAVA
jgi:hypothetical protein